MALFTLLRFLTPNATVSVSEAAGDLSTTAAEGQAIENLDTYALRLNGTNTLTAAGAIDASGASDTAGFKVPSKSGAAPTAAAAVAFDTATERIVSGDSSATQTYVVKSESLVRIADSLLGIAATNITFSSIPATYKHLRIVFSGRGDGAVTTDNVRIQINGDTGAGNYVGQIMYLNAASLTGSVVYSATAGYVGVTAGASDTANSAGGGVIDFPDYASTTFWKTFIGNVSPANQQAIAMASGVHHSTLATSSIKLFPDTSTNFIAGTRATLYGIA